MNHGCATDWVRGRATRSTSRCESGWRDSLNSMRSLQRLEAVFSLFLAYSLSFTDIADSRFYTGCCCHEDAATRKAAAKLKTLTKLAVVKENATRWSSMYNMVNRYFKIQSQLSALVELLELLPTASTGRSRHSVERLQGSGELSSHHNTEMAYHLGTESCLVVNPDFETGISMSRILKGMSLTFEQQAAVSALAAKH